MLTVQRGAKNYMLEKHTKQNILRATDICAETIFFFSSFLHFHPAQFINGGMKSVIDIKTQKTQLN